MEQQLVTLGLLTLMLGSYYLSTQEQLTDYSEIYEAFVEFKSKYNKKYSSAEVNYRFAVYYDNHFKIARHNEDPTQTYKLGETQFMDLTEYEFIDMYLMKDIAVPEEVGEEEESSENDAPPYWDWRVRGMITEVKNQGSCGSCWAFATVGTLESRYMIQNGKQIQFSEQQLVDCAGSDGARCYGCSGGWSIDALGWVKKYGIAESSKYPYKAVTQQCSLKKGDYKISSVVDVAKNKDAIKAAVAKNPVAIAVDASKWSLYKEGVFNNCGPFVNHAVLLVGYDDNQWFVKNSWGTSWGEKGYIRLAPGNTCGLNNFATYPQ